LPQHPLVASLGNLDIVRRAQTDFEEVVEVCQVGARFEALDELVFIGALISHGHFFIHQNIAI